MRERTGDEGSGAASWKLEESAEAFTFRLRKEEEEKKKGEEITRSETMNFWSTDDKKPVWESHSTYLSRFLFAQFSLEEEEEEEESFYYSCLIFILQLLEEMFESILRFI